MENVKLGRGRPKAMRDQFGNIMRDENGVAIPEYKAAELEPVIPQEVAEPQKAPPVIAKPKAKALNDLNMSFDDIESFIESAKTFAEFAANKNHHDYWLTQKKGDWYGMPHGADFKAVVELVSTGWTDGATMLQKRMGMLNIPYVPSVKRRLVWGDNGDELDQNKVWAGNYDTAWRASRRTMGMGPKSFRIVVDSIESGFVEAEQMIWRGVAAVILCDALTEAGHNVEVVSAFSASASKSEIFNRVIVKSMRSPVDIASLAASVALPGFFRAIGHAWIFANLTTKHDSTGVNVNRLETPDVEQDDVSNTFLATNAIEDATSAQQWINEACESLISA